jgi:aerobic-type carbon monoxide dehydrogenase small subunit (CoxS/CutS family)
LRRTLVLADEEIAVDTDPSKPLLEVLRRDAGRRSVVRGCATGTCGACRAIVDGKLVATCTLLWRDLPEKSQIQTYEDVATEPLVERTVAAFADERQTRCRLCVGALGVTAHHLEACGGLTDERIEGALEQATCMCTGRGSLRRALRRSGGG